MISNKHLRGYYHTVISLYDCMRNNIQRCIVSSIYDNMHPSHVGQTSYFYDRTKRNQEVPASYWCRDLR